MKITVCIGSSCHLKGSHLIVEELQHLIAENKLKNQIELEGDICKGNCQNGISVTVDNELFSVTPDTTKDFFTKEVLIRFQ